MYVYNHTNHLSYSSTKLTKISKLVTMDESKELVNYCDRKNCHEVFLPFFHSNEVCTAHLDKNNIPLSSKARTQLSDLKEHSDCAGKGDGFQLKHNNKLVRDLIAQKYGKTLTLKDIQNVKKNKNVASIGRSMKL